MTRIFIENNELDIDKGLVNRITYAIDDLEQLDTKSTAWSKTIVLPGTTNNNKLLGNIFEFNNSNFTNDINDNVNYNFNASRLANCRIEVNGLQIIKGTFRLLEIVYNGSQVEYECQVVGELGGFISKVGNNRLEDLDFSAYDHDYTVANITASWDNANSGTGYYYPLIDVGEVSTGAYGTAKADYQYTAFRPALHVREYMDKIITNAGYTWESDFFDTDFFKRLVIPYNQKDLRVLTSDLVRATRDNNYTIISGTVDVSDYYIYETFYGAGFSINGSNNRITYTDAPNLSCNLYVEMSGQYMNDLTDLSYNILKNGVVIATGSDLFQDTGGPSNFSAWQLAKSIDLDLVTNDYIEVEFVKTGAARSFQIDSDYCRLNITTPAPVYALVPLGSAVTVSDTIPKGIFQKDFFASILKMFYLLVTEDKFKDRHLVITPYVDFYDTTPSSYLDWSDKIDRGKQIRVKPMSEINSRYYELKYKKDSDFYNESYEKRYGEGYGDRIFDNGLEFAKEKETVEVIFSNTPLVGYLSEDKVVPSIFKLRNNVEEKMDHNIRIMQAKKITGVTSWDIMNGATVLSSVTNYGYAGHLDDPDAPNADLCFGVPRELFFTLVSGNLTNNLFNTYYSSYMAEITDKDSRLMEAMVKLSETDIFNLDFSKFIYIDGGIYRLQKINDYEAGENTTSKTELLRVIYTTY